MLLLLNFFMKINIQVKKERFVILLQKLISPGKKTKIFSPRYFLFLINNFGLRKATKKKSKKAKWAVQASG